MRRVTCAAAIIVFGFALLSVQPAEGNAQKNEGNQRGPSSEVVIEEKPEPEERTEVSGKETNATVVLRAVFTRYGKVTDIRLVKVIPQNLSKDVAKDIAKRCQEAARKIRFRPARRDGNPVSVYVQLEYNFHLY